MQLNRELAKCKKLTRSGQHVDALMRLRKVASRAKKTKQPRILASAAEQILALYDHAGAVRLFRKALQLTKGDGEFALTICVILRRHRRYTAAVEFIEAAQKKLGRKDIRPLLLLADIKERLHELSAAEELAKQVLRVNPDSIPAHRISAAVARQENRLDDALKSLSPLTTEKIPAHWEAARAWYELGHIHDKRAEYENAMLAWQKAKAHNPVGSSGDLFQKQADFVREHSAKTIQSVTREQLSRWHREADSQRVPYRLAVLAGHPRSGTTLLEQGLDAHPKVISVEETTIFGAAVHGPVFEGQPVDLAPGEILNSLSPEKLQSFRYAYETQTKLAMGEEQGERLTIDKNPDLLQVLPTLLRVYPEARLLIALRDPRDILLSIFSQALPMNHNAICHLDLESSAKFVGARLGLWLQLRDKLPVPPCELRYEDVVHDFRGEIGRAVEYLGLPWDEACADPSAQARQKVVQSPSYAAVREPVHTKAIGRWKNYLPWLEPHLCHLEGAVEALGYKNKI